VKDEAMTADAGIITKLVAGPVSGAVARFTAILREKNVTVFAVIDQSAAARAARLGLRDTILVVFGNPSAGTPVMDVAPMAALDLPLKVVIWDDAGQTKVSYYSPEVIAGRYSLPADLAAKLAAINPLTDALTGPVSENH
jgi:uncharacterized protein (DUF302 family)